MAEQRRFRRRLPVGTQPHGSQPLPSNSLSDTAKTATENKPPNPTSPHLQFPQSPNPQIPRSPNPQIPQSPNPEIPQSPNRRIYSKSPDPQISRFTPPHLPQLDGLRAVAVMA